MRSLLALLLAGYVPAVLCAQEQYGIAHSNYAGTDAVFLNPARVAGQWPYADIRITGADLFLWNDLVAMAGERHTLLGEVRNGMQGTSGEIQLRETVRMSDHRAFVQAHALAPGFTLALGRGGSPCGCGRCAGWGVGGSCRHGSLFAWVSADALL